MTNLSYTEEELFYKLMKINNLTMVEAAGVEPASEILVSKETPCVVAFRLVSCDALRTDKIRIPPACRSCPANPDIAGQTSLLNDVLPQFADKTEENGYLFN